MSLQNDPVELLADIIDEIASDDSRRRAQAALNDIVTQLSHATFERMRSTTSADVKAWLEARIAELSIVGRPLRLEETRRLEAFMRSRDAIDDALGGDL